MSVDEGLTQADVDAARAEQAAQAAATLARLGELIERFNRQYAVVNEGGRVLVFESTNDPLLERKVLVRFAFADFKRLYENATLTIVKPDGKRVTKSEADWWLKHKERRQYPRGVVFDPTEKVGKEYWNLWSGWPIKPMAGDWSLMRQHLLEVICAGNRKHYKYVKRWLALMFQHPELQGKVALVLRGKKGAGKGILFHYLRLLWGQHGVYISNAKHLTGNFNAHLRDCCFLFADEAFWAGDKQGEAVLKGLITDPVINVEAKYQNAVNVPNMLHIGMASNADWVVPASIDERRYFVFDVAELKIGCRAYFDALGRQMNNGGTAAMLHDLLAMDLSAFNVEDYPETRALAAQKRHSLDSLSRWWLTVLDRGFLYRSRHGVPWFQSWHDTYTTELLRRSYVQWCDETRPFDRKTEGQHGSFLAEIYTWTRPRAELPMYEIDSIDHKRVEVDGLNKCAIVWASHKPGYNVGDLDEARRRFSRTKSITVGQGDGQGQEGPDDLGEPPF